MSCNREFKHDGCGWNSKTEFKHDVRMSDERTPRHENTNRGGHLNVLSSTSTSSRSPRASAGRQCSWHTAEHEQPAREAAPSAQSPDWHMATSSVPPSAGQAQSGGYGRRAWAHICAHGCAPALASSPGRAAARIPRVEPSERRPGGGDVLVRRGRRVATACVRGPREHAAGTRRDPRGRPRHAHSTPRSRAQVSRTFVPAPPRAAE